MIYKIAYNLASFSIISVTAWMLLSDPKGRFDTEKPYPVSVRTGVVQRYAALTPPPMRAELTLPVRRGTTNAAQWQRAQVDAAKLLEVWP